MIELTPQKIIPGLVSITFRAWTPDMIIDKMLQYGLEAVEWGGDVHVPHGDEAEAERVGQKTREAGLQVCSYGSYYRAAAEEGKGPSFDQVLASAVALQAPLIRVWPGTQGSDQATPEDRSRVAKDLARIADLASEEGIGIVLEYHGGTLTDTKMSAVDLLETVNHPNLRTLWQPRANGTLERNVTGLRTILPWLSYVHVFQWRGEKAERRPLAEGEEEWEVYLHTALTRRANLYAMLEFVADDSEESLARDAATLKDWSERFLL